MIKRERSGEEGLRKVRRPFLLRFSPLSSSVSRAFPLSCFGPLSLSRCIYLSLCTRATCPFLWRRRRLRGVEPLLQLGDALFRRLQLRHGGRDAPGAPTRHLPRHDCCTGVWRGPLAQRRVSGQGQERNGVRGREEQGASGTLEEEAAAWDAESKRKTERQCVR